MAVRARRCKRGSNYSLGVRGAPTKSPAKAFEGTWTGLTVAWGSRIEGRYLLTLERDLFGRFAVTRQWGRTGTAGRIITEPFETELQAGDAMARLAALKRRRGYVDL